jgi:hypothetical protein
MNALDDIMRAMNEVAPLGAAPSSRRVRMSPDAWASMVAQVGGLRRYTSGSEDVERHGIGRMQLPHGAIEVHLDTTLEPGTWEWDDEPPVGGLVRSVMDLGTTRMRRARRSAPSTQRCGYCGAPGQVIGTRCEYCQVAVSR